MKLVLAAKSLPLKGINRTMKFLLLTLIAALALSTAVNAETQWLLVRCSPKQTIQSVTWKIPTSSKKECEAEKTKVLDVDNWDGYKHENRTKLLVTAICLKGK